MKYFVCVTLVLLYLTGCAASTDNDEEQEKTEIVEFQGYVVDKIEYSSHILVVPGLNCKHTLIKLNVMEYKD